MRRLVAVTLALVFAAAPPHAGIKAIYDKVNSFVGIGPFENPRIYDTIRLAQQGGEQSAGPPQTQAQMQAGAYAAAGQRSTAQAAPQIKRGDIEGYLKSKPYIAEAW